MNNPNFIMEIAQDFVDLNGADDIHQVPDDDKHMIDIISEPLENEIDIKIRLKAIALNFPQIRYIFDEITKKPAGIWFGKYDQVADRLFEIWIVVLQVSGDREPELYTKFDYLFA